MGTPDFAVATLRKLHEAGKNIVGVITAPDRPAGRGKKLRFSAVKEYALAHNFHILQPTNLKDASFLDELRSLKADLQVVVAFRMLPKLVWDMPPKGTFNIHGSLLPQFRGAAPINHAIICGELETGVTSFFLDKEIDTGRIIASKKTKITDEDNAGTLHDRLMVLGADLALETVDAIALDRVCAVEQSEYMHNSEELKHAPKIFKEDCRIDLSKDNHSIHNLVRGLSPYPAAFLNMANDEGETLYMKIFSTAKFSGGSLAVGELFTDNKTFLRIGTKEGYIEVNELQIQGKKRMPVQDFLRGFHFKGAWKCCMSS